jgi:PAS domain S-box-containing protein
MKGRILIVEDESIVALDLRQALEEFALEVVGSAGSADEALELVEATQPDLALMDINIQGSFDGIQTARILQDPFGVPVVFLTSYSDDTTIEKATRESPYGYLLKPFNRRELKATLQLALHNAPSHTDLRRANRTLTAAVDGAFEALFMISLTGCVQFMNQAAEKLIGIPRSKAVDKNIFKLLDLKDSSGRPALVLHPAKERSVESFGLSLKTSSGKIVLVDLAISALLDNSGGAKRYVISLRDAEKRLQAQQVPSAVITRPDVERKPEAQEDPSAPAKIDAFDLNSSPMVQLDSAGHTLRVNEALVRETGIAAESLLGSTLVDLSQHEDPRIAKMLIPKLQGGAPANLPGPRNDSFLIGKLAPWEQTEDSPPWPL